MIDLHCHILPGIDDGPATARESIELARALAAAGVRQVAATPHVREDHPAVVPAELEDRCRRLQAKIDDAGIALELVPAGEVDLVWALEAGAGERRAVSYGQRGTDLLLETPYGPLPAGFEDHLFGLVVAGYRILLAHPERNPTFQDDPARLAELVDRGTLVQVTTGSLLRPARKSRSARLGQALVAEGRAHAIASDSHGADRARRPPEWAAALAAARTLAGARAEWMTVDAPRAILAGEPLPPPPPLSKRRRWALRQ